MLQRGSSGGGPVTLWLAPGCPLSSAKIRAVSARKLFQLGPGTPWLGSDVGSADGCSPGRILVVDVWTLAACERGPGAVG
eukprot:scaffold1681_cov105-Isochrysis_galbana.AAC.8